MPNSIRATGFLFNHADLCVLQDLPPIEELHITVGDDVRMEEMGKVLNIVGVLGRYSI